MQLYRTNTGTDFSVSRRAVLNVAQSPRNRYLRMTTVRTREYMREYRSRKDSTYRHMFVDLAAETLRQPGQSKFSQPLTDLSQVRRTLQIRNSFYQLLYHMLTPDQYMRNDPPPRTTFLEPCNIKLLIQKSVQLLRMSFTPARESLGDKESTLFVRAVHQYL
jgi:hypothetical protein